MLKTPLQRLAIKIENSPFDEKIKKKLLTKTQEANELFKETFKKFGIIVIPVILTGLLGRNSEKLIFYLCYLVPILYASVRIWEVSNLITEKKKK